MMSVLSFTVWGSGSDVTSRRAAGETKMNAFDTEKNQTRLLLLTLAFC